MDDNQRNAVVARTLEEKKKAEREIALLQSEATRIGGILVEVGFRLQREPESVVFNGVSFSTEYAVGVPSFERDDINGERLAKLTSDLRDQMDSLERLKNQIEKF